MGSVMRPLVRSSMPCSPAGGRALRTWCRSRGSLRVPAGWYARLRGRSWPARVLEPGHRPAPPGLSAGAGRACRAGTAVKGHRRWITRLGVVGVACVRVMSGSTRGLRIATFAAVWRTRRRCRSCAHGSGRCAVLFEDGRTARRWPGGGACRTGDAPAAGGAHEVGMTRMMAGG